MASTSDAATARPAGRSGGRPALRLAFGLIGLVCLIGPGGQHAAAQQACADGETSLPPARFHDNGDGTVTDRESKLMWMRCSGGQQWAGDRCTGSARAFSWADAQQHAQDVSRSGAAFFSDWRVPALRDLATITDRGCANPRTNLAVFPGTPAHPFWSSTLRPGDAAGGRAMALSFGAEGVLLARKDERFHLRLVRSAL